MYRKQFLHAANQEKHTAATNFGFCLTHFFNVNGRTAGFFNLTTIGENKMTMFQCNKKTMRVYFREKTVWSTDLWYLQNNE